MIKSGKKLSELKRQMETYPQVLENVRVREKKDLARYPKIQKAIEKAEKTLGENGRVLVRYSGTEPLARVMVEGQDLNRIKTFALDIATEIRAELG